MTNILYSCIRSSRKNIIDAYVYYNTHRKKSFGDFCNAFSIILQKYLINDIGFYIFIHSFGICNNINAIDFLTSHILIQSNDSMDQVISISTFCQPFYQALRMCMIRNNKHLSFSALFVLIGI